MSLPLGEEELLADFDRRCQRGTIFYDNHPAIQTQTIDGFQVSGIAPHSVRMSD